MHPIRIDRLSAAQHAELDHANRTAKDGRLRTRALIVLLSAEREMVAADIAGVVRMHEETVRRWGRAPRAGASESVRLGW